MGEMDFRHIAEVEDGARRGIRTLPDSVKKVDFRGKPDGGFQKPAVSTKYPAGRPLREEETKAARNHKPNGLDGYYL